MVLIHLLINYLSNLSNECKQIYWFCSALKFIYSVLYVLYNIEIVSVAPRTKNKNLKIIFALIKLKRKLLFFLYYALLFILFIYFEALYIWIKLNDPPVSFYLIFVINMQITTNLLIFVSLNCLLYWFFNEKKNKKKKISMWSDIYI